MTDKEKFENYDDMWAILDIVDPKNQGGKNNQAWADRVRSWTEAMVNKTGFGLGQGEFQNYSTPTTTTIIEHQDGLIKARSLHGNISSAKRSNHYL